MKLVTGTVVNGKVVFEGAGLPDGTAVTVLAGIVAGGFAVPPELEHDLDESLAQAARGETLNVAEALRILRSH